MEVRVCLAAGAPGVVGSGSLMGWYLGRASIPGEMRRGGRIQNKLLQNTAESWWSFVVSGGLPGGGNATNTSCETSWHSSRKAQEVGERRASRLRDQHKQRREEEQHEPTVWGTVASVSFQNREQREGWTNGQRATDVREEGHQRH